MDQAKKMKNCLSRSSERSTSSLSLLMEEFRKVHPKVRVTVGVSGTGGGFKKFYRGETDMSNASRPIKEKEAKLFAMKII